MRIRLPFAGAFLFLLLASTYAALTSLQLPANLPINDKALHFLSLLLITVTFYWILDTSRRRTLNLTLIICTGALGVGSEFAQSLVSAWLETGREFDFYDIVANVAGSLVGVGACSWYHVRMLERRRIRKRYTAVPGGDGGGDVGEDLELGEGVGVQDSGIAERGAATLEEEVDNWDENREDNWDIDEDVDEEGPKTPSASSAGEEERKVKMAG